MSTESTKNPAENLAGKNQPASRLTPELLSQMACLLYKNDPDGSQKQTARSLINFALEIWNVANEELSGRVRFEQDEMISFEVIAKNKMLRSSREKTGDVETGKGVGKAAERYLKALINCYDDVMKEMVFYDLGGREQYKLWLGGMSKHFLTQGKLPKRVLDRLTQFQLDMRKGHHSISMKDFVDIFGTNNFGRFITLGEL